MTEKKTVVLCGSVTRAVAALDAAEAHYLALGYRVHKPVRNDAVAFELHVDRWYQLIDAADVVVACAMRGDFVGEQTRREMERAFTADVPVHLWIEPTTGPAPAAADGLREEYAGFFHPAWPDPLHFQYGDNPRANAARWYAEHVEQQPQIEVRRRVLSDWATVNVTAPAAPQAPAEPTVKPTLDQIHRFITEGTAPDLSSPAAREDTAPPDDYGDDIGGWNYRPSSVPQEGEKP